MLHGYSGITIHEEIISHFTFHGKKGADHESWKYPLPPSVFGVHFFTSLNNRHLSKEDGHYITISSKQVLLVATGTHCFLNIVIWYMQVPKKNVFRWVHQVRSYGQRNLAVNIWWAHFLKFNQSDCENSPYKDKDLIPLNQFDFHPQEAIR